MRSKEATIFRKLEQTRERSDRPRKNDGLSYKTVTERILGICLLR